MMHQNFDDKPDVAHDGQCFLSYETGEVFDKVNMLAVVYKEDVGERLN